MANKRCFSKFVCRTDAFMDMPATTQLLYFQLCMEADDDGFVSSPKSVMRMIGSSPDDLNILIAKRYLLTFDDGVVVIKHWRIHNSLSAGRYTETAFLDDKAMLYLKENREYTLEADDGEVIDDSRAIESGKRQVKRKSDAPALLPEPDEEAPAAEPEDKKEALLPEPDEEAPAADPEAEAKAAKKAAAKKAKAEEDKAADEMMQQLLDMYPIEKRTQKNKLSKAVKKKLYKLGMDKVTKALNRYLDSMRGRETYLYGAGNFFSDYIYQYIDKETVTPNTPTPAAAPAPTTQQPAQARPASLQSAVVEYEDDIDD